MRHWSPDKVTALVLICSCVGLIASGIDSEVKSILAMASVYLFATGITERRAAKKNQQKEEVK